MQKAQETETENNNMKYIPEHWEIDTNPIANSKAIIIIGHWRVTVLTSRLLRIEFDKCDIFEDRATQSVWHRNLPVPEFKKYIEDDMTIIETDDIKLYLDSKLQKLETNCRQKSNFLYAILKKTKQEWHYGENDRNNLKGTCRTLDFIDGSSSLEKGMLSRSGWTVLEDSDTPVFNEHAWIENRNESLNPDDIPLDIYFFGYGLELKQCMQDFYAISEKPAFLPRYALGNWWSKAKNYTQQETLDLIHDFNVKHKIPTSVCVIDMWWHPEKNPYSAGWTGYTWDKKLFPDHKAMLNEIHEQGIHTSLNLHPHEGVYPHEDAYVKMAEHMGIDPESEKPVSFEIDNPKFADAYFRFLHHPHEEIGIDFWWMDWQQEYSMNVRGLSPLWWLNHLHFMDMKRNQNTRPFIFSRWGGNGNHRYPVGFSGDVHTTWESLDFQPYFTATAANVGYHWWSHDICGHLAKKLNKELYARWVQFGVLSPIMRFHSSKDFTQERRPWKFGNETYKCTKEALRFRHKLIPYLYTLAWHSHMDGQPVVMPMYYEHPEREEAYNCPGQYYFGKGLLAAPFTQPADKHTKYSRKAVWLPAGYWYDFFTGDLYSGNAWHTRFGDLEDIPLYASAGSIVPLNGNIDNCKFDNPEEMTVRVFTGADGTFELYEDDGKSQDYQNDKYCITKFNLKSESDSTELIIEKPENFKNFISDTRLFTVEFIGLPEEYAVEIVLDDKLQKANTNYDSENKILTLSDISANASCRIKISHSQANLNDSNVNKRIAKSLRNMIYALQLTHLVETQLCADIDNIIMDISVLRNYTGVLTDKEILILAEATGQVGIEKVQYGGSQRFVVWNNSEQSDAYTLISGHRDGKCFSEKRKLGVFSCITPSSERLGDWRIHFNYSDIFTKTFRCI
jgi:alpha-glucosidase (family GH31 glycosyl hydrolase)